MKKCAKYLYMLTMVFANTVALTSCGNNGRVSRKSFPVTLEEVRNSRGYKADLPSTGNSKALVIPVEFSDYACSSSRYNQYGNCKGIREDIQNAMFGDSSTTNWESLSSYYKKSSYGKLNLTGKVTEWFKPRYSAATLATRYGNDSANPTLLVLRDAIEWYKSNHDDITEFDSDKDGFIDSVYLIYTVPSQARIAGRDTSDLFWAFTYWDTAHVSEENVDINDPTAYTYFWASIDFMYEDKMVGENGELLPTKDENGDWLPDAHTFIHETGHIMGLPDYYTYDSEDLDGDGKPDDYGPLGGIDMMDYNVGDHNAYSKMIYGWTEPYYIDKPKTITIKPFYKSGDCILVNANWNGSMFDEYLLIEYYMPEGLNKYDADKRFAGTYPLEFQKPGVKVYHVDARLGGFDNSDLSYQLGGNYGIFMDYTENISNRYDYCYIAHDNSISRNGANKDFKLISLLESSGELSFNQYDEIGQLKHATDESLFHVGDSFGYDGKAFDDFTFHTGRPFSDSFAPGNKVGYKFVIEKMDANGVTIKFELA